MRSRSTTVKHRRRPELSPAPISAVVAVSRGENRSPEAVAAAPPDPGRPWLTGLDPVLFFRRPSPSPSRPNFPSSAQRFFGRFSPSSGPVQSDPIRPDSFGDFFYFYREAPQLSELGKFST
ncbi:hypothetical protein CRG98_013542 [Punica granatum]|uniref:Uncharacterized protein n=1 Tax=Punica granatum TaxID=22663 RepID=A0A2I0KC02_PUNGR|nr:hypothetical protein CRG98_013542 [Punica granatum]